MRYFKTIAAFFVGAAGGFAYYYFVGCKTGACPLQSNPLFSSLWGGLLGVLIFDAVMEIIRKKRST